MRWIYLAVIILGAATTIIFALQNLEIVTMSFLGFELSARAGVLTDGWSPCADVLNHPNKPRREEVYTRRGPQVLFSAWGSC
jgi:hypothetical protein